MIPSLSDLCLKTVSCHLSVLHQEVRELLPTLFKEALLQRLADHDMFTQEYLPYIEKALFVPELKSLDFSSCNQINDNFLKRLADCGCKLKSFYIGDNVSTDGITAFLNQQNKLTDLKLIISIIDLGFLERLKIPNLRKVALKIYGCWTASGYTCCSEIPRAPLKCLIPFVSHHELLNDFSLTCDTTAMFLGDSYIVEIITRLGEHLKHFQIDGLIPLPPACIHAIANHCPNIQELKLQSYLKSKGVNDSDLKCLANSCPKLEILTLSSIVSCADASCFPSTLNRLSLYPRIDDRIMPLSPSSLSSLINLEYLELPMWYFTADTVYSVLSRIGAQLKGIHFLNTKQKNQDKTLECAVVDAIVKFCYSLKSLELCCYHAESMEGLLSLFVDADRAMRLCRFCLSCDKLMLDVSHIIQNAKLLLFALTNSCENIQELDVDSRFVDDMILIKLAMNCPRLSRLVVRPAGRRHVYKDKITDAAVCKLAANCPLEELSLIESSRYSHLSGFSLKALANCCPSLQSLSFTSGFKFSSKVFECLKNSCVNRVSINVEYDASGQGAGIHITS
ncbi:uncharacterized protein LOC144353411 [Saccoglossus kowalevskii]